MQTSFKYILRFCFQSPIKTTKGVIISAKLSVFWGQTVGGIDYSVNFMYFYLKKDSYSFQKQSWWTEQEACTL